MQQSWAESSASFSSGARATGEGAIYHVGRKGRCKGKASDGRAATAADERTGEGYRGGSHDGLVWQCRAGSSVLCKEEKRICWDRVARAPCGRLLLLMCVASYGVLQSPVTTRGGCVARAGRKQARAAPVAGRLWLQSLVRGRRCAHQGPQLLQRQEHDAAGRAGGAGG